MVARVSRGFPSCARGEAFPACQCLRSSDRRAGGSPNPPVFLVGGRNLVSGRLVNGRRSRSRATARRAAIDAVAASWTIGSEEDGYAGWGGVSFEPARSAAQRSGAAGAALDQNTAQFGSGGRLLSTVIKVLVPPPIPPCPPSLAPHHSSSARILPRQA